MNNESLNIFIEPIIKKKYKHDLFAWISKYKLIKKLNKISPSFNMMVSIHEFLCILRNCYMYSNDNKFHLFLGTIGKNYNPANTLAMIYKEDGFSIKYVLCKPKDNNQINIEITRYGQSKNDIEKISFYDGEYEFKDIYDKEKMLFVISCLMNGVTELINYYYKNKKL